MKKITGLFNRERSITLLAFLWLFTLMTSYYIIKPIRETLLNEMPYQSVPYILITIMVVILVVNCIYDRLARILSSAILITGITVFFAMGFVIFSFVIDMKWPMVNIPFYGIQPGRYILVVCYYLYVCIYNLFIVTVFWSFINEVFRPDEARNNFGTVMAGGTVGGLLGSFLTSRMAHVISLGDLLLLSVIILFITLIFMKLLLSYKEEKIELNRKIDTTEEKKISGFKLVATSGYLQWMLLAMFLTTSNTTLLGYQTNAIVKGAITDPSARAAFWANINLWINGLGLFFQVFLVKFAVQRLGMMTTILISPVLDFTGGFFLLTSQNISSASICTSGHYSVDYSFNRASKEMLYTPATRDFKYQAKAIIDTFVFRLGDGLTSILLISLGSYPLYYIAIINLIVNFLRIIPAIALAIYYKNLIENKERPEAIPCVMKKE